MSRSRKEKCFDSLWGLGTRGGRPEVRRGGSSGGGDTRDCKVTELYFVGGGTRGGPRAIRI